MPVAFSPFYLGVFVVSAVIMTLQILQSRILSIVSWYHLSFAIISLAMLGLTAGALSIFKEEEESAKENAINLIQNHCVWFGIHIIISTLCLLFTPFKLKLIPMLAILFLTYEIFRAYFHAGVVITTLLTRTDHPTAKVYGIDLLGAGFGCLLALGLMNTIDSPSAMILLAGIALLSSRLFGPLSKKKVIRLPLPFVRAHESVQNVAIGGGVLCLLLACVNIVPQTHFLYPVYIKGKISLLSSYDVAKWNSISRVTVKKERKDTDPFLWGPSPITPEEFKSTHKILRIDGDAGTPITKFDGDFSGLTYLEYDVTNIAYSAPDIQKAAVIGVGGGRDVLSAKYFGVSEVTAVDVNPIQIYLLRDDPLMSKYSNISTIDGVTLVTAEARSWFRQNKTKFDLIQMSLIDTWAATGSGAFALTENGLYTVEAWQLFLNNLNANGLFTLSRWTTLEMSEDIERALSITIAALNNLSVSNPLEHIVYVQSARIGTLIVSRSPFSAAQLEAINRQAKEKQFNVIIFPGKPVPDNTLGKLLLAKSEAELNEIYDNSLLDISPATDMRPFFFNQARLSSPFDTLKNTFTVSQKFHFSRGQAKATASLLAIILFSLLAIVVVLLYPNMKAASINNNSLFISGTSYFLLIGFGFMAVEISLMQALGMFLGHPMFGLGVVLFSLILSSGLGSLLSEKITLKSLASRIIWASLLAAYLCLLGTGLSELVFSFGTLSFLNRAAISVALIFPAGLLMGFAFPTGIRLVSEIDSRTSPWFWAINGAAGVLASSLALAFNISFGIDYTLIIAAVCYALLIVCFFGFAQTKRSVV